MSQWVTSKKAVKAIHAPALAKSYGEDNLHEPYGRSGGRYPQYAGPNDFRVEDREQYGSYRDEQEAMNLPKFPFDLGPRDAVRDSATDPLGIDKALVKAVLKGKKKSKPFHGYNPNRHSKKGGLNAKGRAKFKRETGANLKPPSTEKPSSLKPRLQRKPSEESHSALACRALRGRPARAAN